MLAEYRIGALAVVQDVQDKAWLDRRLKAIDRRLFLECQLTLENEWVWCVVEDTEREDVPDRFVVVYEWRDELGRPIPYPTERIVEEIERRRDAGGGRPLSVSEVSEQAAKRNARRREKAGEEQRAQHEDVNKEAMRIFRKMPAESRPSALLTGEFDVALRAAERRLEARKAR